MRRFLLRIAASAALVVSAAAGAATSSEFSADMVITQSTGQTVTEKLYVGKARARLDRFAPGGESLRVNSLIMDFDHQLMYLVLPQEQMYLQIMGSSGIYFYRGSNLFRPQTPDTACSDWIPEADRRGVTMHCQQAGQETIDGRPAQRWDATATNGAHGSLWYDPSLNFVVKVVRVTKDGVQTGYELKDIKPGPQPADIFELPTDYRQFTFNRLFELLTKLGQW